MAGAAPVSTASVVKLLLLPKILNSIYSCLFIQCSKTDMCWAAMSNKPHVRRESYGSVVCQGPSVLWNGWSVVC